MQLDAPTIVAYNTFHAFAAIGTFLLFTTAILSSRVSRWREWYMMMAMFFVASVSSLLLIGHQSNDNTRPPETLCVYQATLIYPAYPAAGTAALAFVLRQWHCVRTSIQKRPERSRMISNALFISPIIVSVTMIVGLLLFASSDITKVQRNPTGLYCNLRATVPFILGVVLCGLFMVPVITAQVWVIVVVYKRWESARKILRSHDGEITLSTIIRLTLLTLSLTVSLGLTAIFSSPEDGYRMQLSMASLSVSVVVIFLDTDILRVWAFWLPAGSSSQKPHAYNYTI